MCVVDFKKPAIIAILVHANTGDVTGSNARP